MSVNSPPSFVSDIPKDCDDAKSEFKVDSNRPLYIDPDGDGGSPPFLVYCDVDSFRHVGITQINPRQ